MMLSKGFLSGSRTSSGSILHGRRRSWKWCMFCPSCAVQVQGDKSIHTYVSASLDSLWKTREEEVNFQVLLILRKWCGLQKCASRVQLLGNWWCAQSSRSWKQHRALTASATHPNFKDIQMWKICVFDSIKYGIEDQISLLLAHPVASLKLS